DIVTAVSDSLRDQTYDLINPDKKIETVYNFVDEREYFPQDSKELKAELGIEPDQKVMIHVSNFRNVKRVQDVVETLSQARQQLDCKLLLVGDGPEMGRIIQQVRDLGLEDHVLFLGKRDSLAEFYNISDIKIHLSEKEAFGLVLLEAMACGVPVIGSNIGGMPEIIVPGVNGYLVELGDTKQAAEYAIEMMSDENKLEELRQ